MVRGKDAGRLRGGRGCGVEVPVIQCHSGAHQEAGRGNTIAGVGQGQIGNIPAEESRLRFTLAQREMIGKEAFRELTLK